MIRKVLYATILAAAFCVAPARADLKVGAVLELSGSGATAGVNFRDGMQLAFKEINASGGVLGQQVGILEYDVQTDAQLSRAMMQKAIDDGVFAIAGTIYSGLTIVNMSVAQQAGIPQFTGSQSPAIVSRGNEFIFRTAISSNRGVPKVARYMVETMRVKKVAVSWTNNEYGKSGRDAFVQEMEKAGIPIVADVPSEQAQTDFSADVLRLKNSDADAIFIYANEEEGARLLQEAKKQDIGKPMLGDSALTGQQVIELAGDAMTGFKGHTDFSPESDIPGVKGMVARFKEQYKYSPDTNAFKGYVAAWTIKYATELAGSTDGKAIADKMHGLTLKAADYPGVLLDTSWDEKGDMTRASFFVKIENGKQVVEALLP
jgi:branched-chain amino acid transport system substrate-binding protein